MNRRIRRSWRPTTAPSPYLYPTDNHTFLRFPICEGNFFKWRYLTAAHLSRKSIYESKKQTSLFNTFFAGVFDGV